MTEMSWTHPMCGSCWHSKNGGRSPHLMPLPLRETEQCAWCGCPTTSGIYVREDPTSVPHPAREDA